MSNIIMYIKYSMRHLICDVNYRARTTKLRYGSKIRVDDISTSSCISHISKLCSPLVDHRD